MCAVAASHSAPLPYKLLEYHLWCGCGLVLAAHGPPVASLHVASSLVSCAFSFVAACYLAADGWLVGIPIAAGKLPDRTCESVRPLARYAARGIEDQTSIESGGGIGHHVSCLPAVCVCGCCCALCCALSLPCALLASCAKRRPSRGRRRNSGGEIDVNRIYRLCGRVSAVAQPLD